MAQSAERKGGGKVLYYHTDYTIILGGTDARTPNLLGGVDHKVPLGHDRKI